MENKKINFEKNNGLIPVIIQDFGRGDVLMLGYMNQLAFEKTRETKLVHFWSRSRNELWLKGETSGNTLEVKSIFMDCDQDTLLVQAQLNGTNVCHTGEYSCFFEKLI